MNEMLLEQYFKKFLEEIKVLNHNLKVIADGITEMNMITKQEIKKEEEANKIKYCVEEAEND